MEYLLAIIFGLTTAIGWGVAPIFSKRSYDTGGDPIIASLILSIIGSVFLILISLLLYDISYLAGFNLYDIYPFIVTGFISTGFGRFLSYKGIYVLGASINSSFIASNSIFGILFAYIFLDESLSIIKILAVVSVVIGLIIVSSSNGGNRNQNISKILLIIPITASLLYGFGSFFRRFGLTEVSGEIPFIYAVAINEFTALIIISIIVVTNKKDSLDNMKIHNYRKFIMSGIFNVIGTSSSFAALNYGPVYIGATIGSTSTIITLISTHIFLNDLEKLTKKIYIGSILVVIGVILVVI